MTHNEPATGRELFIAINAEPVVAPVAITDVVSKAQNLVLPVLRPFVIGPGQSIRFEATFVAAGFLIVGHAMFLELEIGAPHPGL